MLESIAVEIEELPDNDPELMSPYKEPYRLQNWSREELMMYVGGDKELYR